VLDIVVVQLVQLEQLGKDTKVVILVLMLELVVVGQEQ
jgi:hypothetical protein